MKRNILLVIAFCVLLFSSVAYAIGPVKILLNGTEITNDAPIEIIDGMPMIPIDLVDDCVYGVNGTWDGGTNTLSINDLKSVLPQSARSVIDCWVRVKYCKTSKLYPRIEGPNDFKQLVTDAFELLQQKAPDAFAYATTYIDSIILTDCDALAAINMGTGQMEFDKDYYKALTNYTYRVQEVAAVLAHEACHMQLAASGLYFTALVDDVTKSVTRDDAEAIAVMTQLRVAEKLGMPSQYLKLCKNWLKKYVETL